MTQKRVMKKETTMKTTDTPNLMLREGIKKLNDRKHKHKNWTTKEATIIIAIIAGCFVGLYLVNYFGI